MTEKLIRRIIATGALGMALTATPYNVLSDQYLVKSIEDQVDLDLPAMSMIVEAATVNWPMSAKKPLHTFALSKDTVPTYDKNHLKEKGHHINGASDEILVFKIENGWAECSYPLDSGGSRKCWLPVSAFTNGTIGESFTAKAKVDTYRRSDIKNKAGNTDKSDKVWLIDKTKNAKQILYNIID